MSLICSKCNGETDILDSITCLGCDLDQDQCICNDKKYWEWVDLQCVVCGFADHVRVKRGVKVKFRTMACLGCGGDERFTKRQNSASNKQNPTEVSHDK